MASMKYRAVLFDLFDTLVRFDRERLPLVQVDGRGVRSTVGQLHEVLCGWAPDVPLEALYGALTESWREDAREALFVGDRADIDVAGALAVGMDVAWMNPAAEPLPPGLAAPTYELRDLDDLRAILGVAASDARPAASNG